ncbi:hypothetical protein ACHAW6_000106, partial [Cyclotella cf. meneghiniana]
MQLTKTSNKVVVTANGTMLQASNIALLNTASLSKGAWEAIDVPGMQQKAFLSVATLADYGYTVIFSPGQQGIAIYQENDMNISLNAEPVLQGWRDKTRLWIVPITDNPFIRPNFD